MINAKVLRLPENPASLGAVNPKQNMGYRVMSGETDLSLDAESR